MKKSIMGIAALFSALSFAPMVSIAYAADNQHNLVASAEHCKGCEKGACSECDGCSASGCGTCSDCSGGSCSDVKK